MLLGEQRAHRGAGGDGERHGAQAHGHLAVAGLAAAALELGERVGALDQLLAQVGDHVLEEEQREARPLGGERLPVRAAQHRQRRGGGGDGRDGVRPGGEQRQLAEVPARAEREQGEVVAPEADLAGEHEEHVVARLALLHDPGARGHLDEVGAGEQQLELVGGK